jgi:tape measure domain-containing protein
MNIIASAIVELAADVGKLRTGLEDAARIADKNFSKIAKSADQVKTAFAGVTAGIAVGKILEMADSYNVLQSRIVMATKATGDYLGVSQQLFKISQQTGASLKDSTDVFQRLSLAAGNLGASNKDLLTLTSTVQKLGVMGGASTQALNAGLLQFGQAMGGGVVHAEELNSIIENMPLVAQKIAAGMAMTTAELRKAVIDGKVLSKDVFASLMKQAPEIAEQFKQVPLSLGRAMANMKTSFEQAIGQLDSSIGITKTLAAGVQLIADHAKLATNAIIGLGVAAAVFKVMTIDVVAIGKAMMSLTAILAANPYGAALAAVAGLTAALIAVKDESFAIGKSQVTLSTLIAATWEKMAPGLTAVWEYVKKAATKSMENISKAAQWLWKNLIDGVKTVIGLLTPIFQKLGDLPFFGAFKTWGADVAGIYKNLEAGAKQLGAEFTKTSDEIVKRAAEMNAAANKVGSVSDKKGEGKTNVEVDKKKLAAAAKMQEHADKFFRTQIAINKAAEYEAEFGKEAADFEEKRAQFREQVGRDMLPKELMQLQSILDVRQKLAQLEAFKAAVDATKQDAQMLELKRKGLEEQIPFYNTINQLKQQGITLTQQEQTVLQELMTANYVEEKNQATAEYIKKLDEQNLKLQEEITLGKDQAAVNAAIREAKAQNKFIDDEALENIGQRLEKEKELTKELEEQKKWKDIVKDIDKKNADLQLAATQNPAAKEQLKTQMALSDAAEKMGRDLTDVEAQTIAAGIAQQGFLERGKEAGDVIKANRTEQEIFNEEVQRLNQLYAEGHLNANDYAKAIKSASPEFKKIHDFAKDTASSFSKAMDDWLIKGKSLKDTFKDLGKALLANVAKKALFDPLEGGLTKFLENSLWKGPKTQPIVPGLGGGQSGQLAYNPAMPAGGLLGGAMPGSITAGGNVVSSGAITATGPVYINGQSLTGTGGGSMFGGLQSTLSNLFTGLMGGLKNIISAPFNLLANLFGGGSGGLLGGLKNLLSPLTGLVGGLFSSGASGLGKIFGGFREMGGSISGQKSYIVGEAGPELFTPGRAGAITSNNDLAKAYAATSAPLNMPSGTMNAQQAAFFGSDPYAVQGNAYLDMLAITQRTSGEPLYKTISGFQPTMTPRQKEIFDKIKAYESMGEDAKQFARTTMNGYPTNAERGELMQSTLSTIDFQTQAEINRWTDQYNDAIANAVLSQPGTVWNNQRNWAADTLSNKTWASSTISDQTKVALPDGNQTARIFMAMAHRGVVPTPTLMQKLNTRDWWADVLKPGANWQAMQTSSGSRMGMAGLGSGSFQSIGYTDLADPKGGWGNPGSGLQSFIPPSIWGGAGGSRGYGDPDGGWGSGLGYLRGAHDPAKFKNNSLLDGGGNGVGQFNPNYVQGEYWYKDKNGNIVKGVTPDVGGAESYIQRMIYGGVPGNADAHQGIVRLSDASGFARITTANGGSFIDNGGAGGSGSAPPYRFANPSATGTDHTLNGMPGYRPEPGFGRLESIGNHAESFYGGGVMGGALDGKIDAAKTAYDAYSTYKDTKDYLKGVIPSPMTDIAVDSAYETYKYLQTDKGKLQAALVQYKAQELGQTALGAFTSGQRAIGNFATQIGTGAANTYSNFFSKIKGYAMGGMIESNEIAMVGEKGPELIIPHTAGRVIPNNRMNGGGGNVYVELHASNPGDFQVTQRRAPNGDTHIMLQELIASTMRTKGGAVQKAMQKPRNLIRS